MAKRFRIGRSAITGRFKTVAEARAKKRTHIVQLIRKRRKRK